MKKYVALVAGISINIFSFAQNPPPAKAQREPILIINATAHLGNGQTINNAVIGFENGKLVIVAEALKFTGDKSKFNNIIDAKGKHVYPGFIDCNSGLGLSEIDAVRSTRDAGETGDMNTNVRSIIAYNTDSKVTPTVRNNGVLLAQIVPRGGTISGQSSVVELDGWNWEDAAYKTDIGIHLNWPRMFVNKGEAAQPEEKQRENMNKALSSIDQFFKEAKAYYNSVPVEKNLRFEAMKGLFDGSKKLFVHCDFVKEIVAAVNFSKKYEMKMVLIGCDDSWMVTDLLKENNVGVVLGRTHSLPSREDDDIDLPYKLPYLLKQGGVTFAQSIEGTWNIRNLCFMTGTSATYGLTKEEALMSITSGPAKILGIDSTVGTLETGKDATLFISSGDALDMRTNHVERAFIGGKEINLDDVQKQLNAKYRDKYQLK